MTYIYILKDEKNEIRYVGKTCISIKRRLQSHICEARKRRTNNRRLAWIRSLLKRNVTPTIQLLDWDNGDGAEAEIYWIKFFRDEGCRLVNGTDGGDAPMLGKKHSLETRMQLSVMLQGKKPWNVGIAHTEDTIDKMRISHLGKTHSIETLKKLKAVKHEPLSPESQAKRIAKLLGRKHSEEHKKKIAEGVSAARKLKNWSTARKNLCSQDPR